MRRTIAVFLAALGLMARLGSTASAAKPRPAPPPRDSGGDSCRKLPPGKRIVRLNLKPDTNLADLVSWISSITCKQFIIPGSIAPTTKTVTIVSPQLLTPEEAYRLFLDALDSVGLTVYRAADGFLRVIETSKAKQSPIPLIVPPPPPPDGERERDDTADSSAR